MSNQKASNIFTTLYANRIAVAKGQTSVINLSLLFCIIALLTAPWLVIGGALAALMLGYKFSYLRNASDFCADLNTVVQEAKSNVRSAVDAVTRSDTVRAGKRIIKKLGLTLLDKAELINPFAP